MALPAGSHNGFEAAQIAFEAEEEPIFIMPRQTIAPIELGWWRTPALKPLRRTEVPLWLAVLLKQQQRCNIIYPSWFKCDKLKEFVELERREPQFSPLPWHWRPIVRALLNEAPEDTVDDVDELRQLIAELEELRTAKIRAGVQHVNHSHMQMDGISRLELNELRPLIVRSMALLQNIEKAAET